MHNIQELASSKQFLRSIANNNYELPAGIDSFAFACALLANLASTDEEMRDELSYMLLASGIIDGHKLTMQQMDELLKLVLNKDHLFYAIGDVGNDSVFMRSFSNLIVAAILYTNNRDSILPAESIHRTKDALLRYAEEEKDWRGYVEGKGWAHTMAHLADALDECALDRYMSTSDREHILKAVGKLIKLAVPLYHEEDMRLAMVAYRIIISKGVSDEFLTSWIADCYVERNTDISSWMSASNAKNFLRSLYFLLHWDNMAQSIVTQISTTLKKQDEVYLSSRS